MTWNLKFCFSPFQYSAHIEENTLSSELLRFQVIDLDEEFTDNWLAVYFFTSGNEGNWFEIQTDPRTNEGILKVVKVKPDFPQQQKYSLLAKMIISTSKLYALFLKCHFFIENLEST